MSILLILIPFFFLVHFRIANSQPSLAKITYLISADENSWASYRVSIVIESNSEDELVFGIPDRLPNQMSDLRNVDRIYNFVVYGENNSILSYETLSPNRWLVHADEHRVLRVIYDVNAKRLAEFGPYLTASGAIIHSGLVFMYIEDHLHLPLKVRFLMPNEWKIATSLIPTNFLFEYVAPDYYTLINCPIQIGNFKDMYFSLNGKTVYVIFNQFNGVNLDVFLSSLRKITRVQTKIFNEIPFEKYYFFIQITESSIANCCTGFQSACTIQLSTADVKNNSDLSVISPLIAHEFFRQWNGIRIQPDSGTDNFSYQTPNIFSWFTEGLSAYYADLTMVRAKIRDESYFLEEVAEKIAALEKMPLRKKVTLEEACIENAKSENHQMNSLINAKGYLAALFLDLKIREVTENRRSLDDVMRFMNWWFAKNQQKYHYQEIVKVVNSVSQFDFKDFFNKCIAGTQEVPCSDFLAIAGYGTQIKNYQTPSLGELPELTHRNRIVSFLPESGLGRNGIKIGDEIISVDTIQVHSPQDLKEAILKLKINSTINVGLRRNKTKYNLSLTVIETDEVICQINPLANMTSTQAEIRKTWLDLPPEPMPGKP